MPVIEQLLTTENYVAISFILSAFLIFNNWNTGKQKNIARIHSLVLAWTGLIYINFTYQYLPTLSQTYYTDWIVSTPLIVLAYGYTVTSSFNLDVVQAAVLQAGVIATGYLATTTQYTTLFFALSSILLLAVFYKFVEMDAPSRQPVLTVILGVTWLIYPALWLVSGGDLLQVGSALVAVPLISKHLFALVDVYLS